jgi:hypothetical protein
LCNGAAIHREPNPATPGSPAFLIDLPRSISVSVNRVSCQLGERNVQITDTDNEGEEEKRVTIVRLTSAQ